MTVTDPAGGMPSVHADARTMSSPAGNRAGAHQSPNSVAHIVTFRWLPDVTSAQIDELAALLSGVAHRIDGLIRFACGSDLGIRDSNADFAILAEFETEAALRCYLTDPEHVAIVKGRAPGLVAAKQGVHLSVPRLSGNR